MTKEWSICLVKKLWNKIESNIDRLTISVDTIDVMLKHSDQVMIDHQRELRNLRDKIDNGKYNILII